MRPTLRIAGFFIAFSLLLHSASGADKFKRIAIMPFDNLGREKALDSLGIGIAETLITELGRIPDLTLVERTRLNDAQKEIRLGQSGAVDEATAQKMGRFLGAGAVVVGSFQRDPQKLRIVARIVDVETGRVSETTKVDGPPNALLDLQDQLAVKLLEAMKGTLADADRRRLGVSPSSSIDAVRALSDGVAYYKLDLFQDAITAFEKALALDPNYTDAEYYKGLALSKLKRWDDAIASFKRTLPRAPTEHTVKWSWDAPFDVPGSRRSAYPAIDPGTLSIHDLLSPEIMVRGRRRLVYTEQADNKTVFYFVDPVRHTSQRLEIPERIVDLGLAFVSERVILVPAATPAGLLSGKFGVYGFSASDGEQLWHTDLPTRAGVPLLGLVEDVFLSYSAPGQLLAISDTTLQKKWQRDIDLETVPLKLKSTRAFGNVLIGKSATGRKIHAIRLSDGQDAWTAELQSDKTYHIVSDQVVVVFEPDRVFAIDPESGRTLLNVPVKPAPQIKTFGILGTFITVPAVINNGTLYFVSDAREIVAVDLARGTLADRRQRWKTAPQKEIRGLSANGTHVYAGTEDGELLIVDSRSGRVVAVKAANKAFDLEHSDDDIVVASSAEAVFGFNPDTGAKEWDYPSPSRTKRPLYFKGVVILETSGTSRLLALDANTGTVLWQYAGGLPADGVMGDFGASVPKVYLGEESLFVIQPEGVREYALNRNANQGITNKEALTELAGALLEKGEVDEATRFADIVGRDADPNYPPLRYLRSRIAQARGDAVESLQQMLTYADLVGRQSKAGEQIISDLKRNRGLLWTTEVGTELGGVLLVDGKLIAGNEKQLLALDTRTGKVLWSKAGEHISGRVNQPRTYDPKTRRLFYANRPNRDPRIVQLYTVDIDRGERKEFARITMPNDIALVRSAYANGRLFVLTISVGVGVAQQLQMRIGAFNGVSGVRLWEKPVEVSIAKAMAFEQSGGLFYPKGNFLVYSNGGDMWVVRGEDGVVHAEHSEAAGIIGKWLTADDSTDDADIAYFGTTSGEIVGYSLSAKQVVLRTAVTNNLPQSALSLGYVLRDGAVFDLHNGSIFAFDLRRETPDANRLKWQTDPQRDGRFSAFRMQAGDLWGIRPDSISSRIDPATGKILNEYRLLWDGSALEDGDRRYGFTADGLAFGMQLKPAQP